jgi:hypothetical protein
MRNKILTFISICVVFFSCRPEPDDQDLVDEFVVSTNYDQTADFSEYATYSIPTDTIGFVSNSSNDTIIVQTESSFPRPVLQAIRSAMNARGYAEVDRTANPDLAVNVLVANNFNVSQQVVYPGNYYSGYYGYNSFYYYPYIQTYVSNTGVLIIELVDLKNRTPDNKVKVIWTAHLGDVYNTLDRVKQAQSGIEEAFTQSPYIAK